MCCLVKKKRQCPRCFISLKCVRFYMSIMDHSPFYVPLIRIFTDLLVYRCSRLGKFADSEGENIFRFVKRERMTVFAFSDGGCTCSVPDCGC